MKLIHFYWICPHCGEEVELFSEDIEQQLAKCPFCGYSMDFDDFRFDTFEKEF